MTFFRSSLFFIAIFSLSAPRLLGQRTLQVAKIDQFLQTMLGKSNVSGFSIAVVTKDSALFIKGYGVNSNGQLVTAQSPFAIASLSKAFTAMSVMQLAASHKINLTSPVNSYIPLLKLDDPRHSKITVDHLLHQTSGLNDQVFPELAFNMQSSSLDEAISRMKHVRLGSDPGKQYRYHNPNYQLLAKVVETAGQQPFPHYLEHHIFKPLGMINTSDVALTDSLGNTSSHFQNGHIFALGMPISIKEPDWFVEGAAGIVSSAADMARWLRWQMNDGRWNGTTLLDRAHLRAMHTATKLSPYGMGWFINEDKTIGHSGILWTYSSEQMITANGYGIVILFNSGINPFVDYRAFIQGVADILNNKIPDVPILPSWLYSLSANLIIILFMTLAVRRLLRRNQWHKKFLRRPTWQSALLLLARTFPIIFFLCIPVLVTALSGRVLNWKRIFLIAPDIITGLAVIALLHLMIVVGRLSFVINCNNKQ